jgi:iron complex transport system ATP-binding protein
MRAESAILALNGVSVQYPRARTFSLSGVSLRVDEGDVVALLGANGAGKSTLLRVAAALTPVTGGSARVRGKDVWKISRRELARLVALVPQNESAPAGFRVREVVAMGRAAHQGAWMREQATDRGAVDEALARCDLARLAGHRIETLSGGEQRRVGIARALAQKPRLLLLDEPAAFLDVRHRLELYELLATIARTDGIASLCTMHDLDTAARYASRVVLMRKGSIVSMGSPAEVMTGGQLEEVLGTVVAVGVHEESGRRYFLPLRAADD